MALHEITRYHNDLNSIPFGKLTASEMNIFFSIITKMQNQEDNIVRFYLSELKDLCEYNRSEKRFLNAIRSTYKKLLSLNFSRYLKGGLIEEHFVLFTKFTIYKDTDTPYIDIQVNNDFIPILNNLEYWVRYNLHDFNSLKSSYSKTIYRILKQYRVTGYVHIKQEKFLKLLDVPKSFRQTHINQKILEVAQKELQPLFNKLRIEKEYGKGRGKPVIGYYFYFYPEERNQDHANNDSYNKKKNIRKVGKTEKVVPTKETKESIQKKLGISGLLKELN